MERKEYRELLSEAQYTEDQCSACEKGVELLESYLSSLPEQVTLKAATEAHVPPFTASLISQGLNERNHLVGIYFYAGMIKNYRLQVGIIELIDGFEINENLHRAIGDELGPEAQVAIYKDAELPVLGTTPLEWTRINAIVFPRLQAMADAATVKRILRSGLRNLPYAGYLPIKERYDSAVDIDAFLEDRGRRHLDNLIKQRDEGTPYFNQFIDDSVIHFVQNTPEIGRGVRQGNTIIEIKIPHQSIEYLATTDIAAKQYHVCHCPLVKESIRDDNLTIESAFCDFCPSFNAKPWEVIFGQKLQYEVLESALRGDTWCKFAIHLPDVEDV